MGFSPRARAASLVTWTKDRSVIVFTWGRDLVRLDGILRHLDLSARAAQGAPLKLALSYRYRCLSGAYPGRPSPRKVLR